MCVLCVYVSVCSCRATPAAKLNVKIDQKIYTSELRVDSSVFRRIHFANTGTVLKSKRTARSACVVAAAAGVLVNARARALLRDRPIYAAELLNSKETFCLFCWFVCLLWPLSVIYIDFRLILAII